jgi:hypothetical protein
VDEVSEAELGECAADGRVLDGDDGGTRRLVAAGLLRRLCYQLKDQVDPHGIRLRNARVSGQLDIAGLNIPYDGSSYRSALYPLPARMNACPRRWLRKKHKRLQGRKRAQGARTSPH